MGESNREPFSESICELCANLPPFNSLTFFFQARQRRRFEGIRQWPGRVWHCVFPNLIACVLPNLMGVANKEDKVRPNFCIILYIHVRFINELRG